MAVVRRYEGRQQGLAPLPGARRRAAETGESLGANVAREKGRTFEVAAGVVGRVGEVALSERGRIIQEEREHADDVALLDAKNQLDRWETQRLYDPETGAFTKQGKDALTLPEDVDREYSEVAGEIEKTLSTDRQRAAFAKLRGDKGANLDLSIRRHVLKEMQAYEANELQATVTNSTDSAIANALDPRRVQVDLADAVSAIERHGPRLGLGPEQIEKQVADVRTRVHIGVIERLLATDNTRSAEVYFEEAKGQISGDAVAKVEKALAEGTLRKQAQEAADKILTKGGTLTEQREAARAIEDPKLRDEVMQRIEHEDTVRDRVERETAENNSQAAYNAVDQRGRISDIPPAMWSELSGPTRASLRAYARAKAEGIPIQTDYATYYRLMDQAGTNPEAFAKLNLMEVRGKLDDVEFKQIVGLQLSVRSGDTKKAEKDLNTYRTTSQIVNATIGLDPGTKPSSPEAQAVTRIQTILDRQVLAAEQLTGKKVPASDIQGWLDQLLLTQIETTKGTGSNWSLFPGGTSRDSVTKSLVDIRIADIPKAERTQVEEALRKRGRPVTDATILDLYIANKLRSQ